MRAARLVLAMVFVGGLTLTGCGGTGGAQEPAALEGVEWTLSGTSVADVDVSAVGIIAQFEGGQMLGFSGVNTYRGPYEADTDGSFKAGPLTSTLMAGPEPLMAAEQAYLKLLEAAESFEVADGTLTLTTADGDTLSFEAAEPFELAGTSWTITGYNNGKEAVVGPAGDAELTLEFGTDGTVSGNGGVNTFSGSFEVDGDSITIGPLATTMMAGPEELMAQEQQYLAALQAGVTWDVFNGVLTTRDAEGAMQINAVQ